jgi:hypothetical protein
MVTQTGNACGTCSQCGKEICRPRPADIAVCDCWEYCPMCGRKMDAFTPDLTPTTYESGDMDVIKICTHHTPPYKSKVMPVEVRLS